MASDNPTKKKILIMDDEDAICDITTIILRRLGYDPITVSNGDDAVKAYKSAKENGNGFDLVILDLTIPGGKGGREVMNDLKQYDAGVCALVSSGDANDPAVISYQDYGFSGVLMKPYNKEKLSECINAYLTTNKN